MEILEHEIKNWDAWRHEFKYYHARVNVIRDNDPYSEFWVRIIHEDSEEDYKEMQEWLVGRAKGYKQGSGDAKMAWMDFYEFKRTFFWVRYAYAITCHKSQGSTYDIAVVLESDIDKNAKTFEKNRILYTACTRPRKDLIVIY